MFGFPSKTDTFGLVLLEAMACGLPVAAYPVTGPIDVVGGSRAAHLDENLEVAVKSALKLSKSDARAHAQNFSWEKATDSFESFLLRAQVSGDYSVMNNPYKVNYGVNRAIEASKNSLSGLRFVINEESAFRQELVLAVPMLILALILSVEPILKLVMVMSLIFVLIVELLNSSVEVAVDRISFSHHGLSKRAKDYGSAAVFLSLILCLSVYAFGILQAVSV